MKYIVAGHIFQIKGLHLYESIAQRLSVPYGPFSVKDNNDLNCDPLFVFELVEQELTWETNEAIFSNIGNVEPGFVGLSLYKDNGGFHFEFSHGRSTYINGRLSIGSDIKRARMYLSGNNQDKWATFNIGVICCYMLATTEFKTLLVHSSCVKYRGKAYIFLGKSGTGKSTHSQMWIKALDDVELINDDHPVIRINDMGEAIVYGSPWSGKTQCYINTFAPLGGIVRISRALYNKASRMTPVQAYGSLLTSSCGIAWEQELANGRDMTLQQIIKSVPSWLMECLPNEDAALVCSSVIVQ